MEDLGIFCGGLIEFGSRGLFFRWKVEPSLNFASVDNESRESSTAAYGGNKTDRPYISNVSHVDSRTLHALTILSRRMKVFVSS
jgi:hypothetical protein